MALALDTTGLGAVSGLVADRLGLHFPEDRWADLARGLAAAAQELGCEPAECARLLTAGALTARQLATLASHLTVGETYFLRDPASFDVLEREILPPIIARRAETTRTLRLWSAGCCTGEEAYSLAVVCTRLLPDRRSWNVSILATDINAKFLAKAEAGVYSDWSFRGVPAGFRERFFSPAPNGKVAIDPALKSVVRFGYLNFAEDTFPSLDNQTNAMDVIFCRNVIMYFDPDRQRRVVAALHRCLVEGGALFVNPAEASSSLFSQFYMDNIGGVLVHRKTSNPPRSSRPPTAFASAFVAPEPEVLVAPPAPAAPLTPLTPLAPLAAVAPDPPLPDDSRPEEPLALARTLADAGRLPEALASCDEAIARERTNPTAHYLRATICEELGRNEDAVAALGKVLYLDQDFILAHHALGGLHRRRGDTKASRRHFGIASKLLAGRGRDELVPASDGTTCGRLIESIRALLEA